MRIVATLQEPQAGRVSFGEIDLLRRPREVRKLLGYLPQEFGFDPRLSAEGFLDHLAVLRGVLDGRARRVRVGEALERTHLSDVRRRRLGTFSGGMKQRLGVAQALLAEPRLLVVGTSRRPGSTLRSAATCWTC
jgi:ABC-type multidrug transport system ATPase subunit